MGAHHHVEAEGPAPVGEKLLEPRSAGPRLLEGIAVELACLEAGGDALGGEQRRCRRPRAVLEQGDEMFWLLISSTAPEPKSLAGREGGRSRGA